MLDGPLQYMQPCKRIMRLVLKHICLEVGRWHLMTSCIIRLRLMATHSMRVRCLRGPAPEAVADSADLDQLHWDARHAANAGRARSERTEAGR